MAYELITRQIDICGSIAPFTVVQHDSLSRILRLVLTDDGQMMNLSGDTAVMVLGTSPQQTLEGEISGNVVDFAIPASMTAVPGRFDFEIVLSNGDAVLSTKRSLMEVAACVRDGDALLASGAMSAIDELISAVQMLEDRVKTLEAIVNG